MKYFYLLFCLISCWSTMRCWMERKKKGINKCNYKNDFDKFCIQDGTGYETWKCRLIDASQNIKRWNKEETVMCPKPHNKCRCFLNDYDLRECECVHPKKLSPFPPTGVIRWDGTFYFDNGWWVHYDNPRTVNTPGEIHKDSSGRFLHKWTEITHWPKGKAPAETKVKYQIIIPNGNNAFLKFTGDESSKSCNKTNVLKGGYFTSIWKKPYNKQKQFTLINSKPSTTKKDVDIEEWHLKYQYEDGMDEWKRTVEYDKKTKYSIPVKYYYREEDAIGGELKVTRLHYTYEPIEENEESFRLEDYCDNEFW